MCYKVGNYFSAENKHSKLMKQEPELIIAGAWSLHLGSYLMESMPYLQFFSLLLATIASILTLRKLLREERKNDQKRKS